MKIIGQIDFNVYKKWIDKSFVVIDDARNLVYLNKKELRQVLESKGGQPIEVCSLYNDHVRKIPANLVLTKDGKLTSKGNKPLCLSGSAETGLDGEFAIVPPHKESNFNINGKHLGRVRYYPTFAYEYGDLLDDHFIPYIIVYLSDIDFIYLVYKSEESNYVGQRDWSFESTMQRLEYYLLGNCFFFKLCGKIPWYRGKHRSAQGNVDTSHWIYGVVLKNGSFGILDLGENEFGITTLLDTMERQGIINIPILNINRQLATNPNRFIYCKNYEDYKSIPHLGQGLFEKFQKMYGRTRMDYTGKDQYDIVRKPYGYEVVETINGVRGLEGIIEATGGGFIRR